MQERRSALRWTQKPRTIRTMQVTEELDAEILDFMHDNDLASYSAAIRLLVATGLDAIHGGHDGPRQNR